MSQDTQKRSGIKWPICTILILGFLGAVGYWGYGKFQSERAQRAVPKTSLAAPALRAPAGQPPPKALALPSAPKGETYRGGLPIYFLIGFATVMTALLGGILYLWWSLKDWEGGKKYGEDDGPATGGNSPSP